MVSAGAIEGALHTDGSGFVTSRFDIKIVNDGRVDIRLGLVTVGDRAQFAAVGIFEREAAVRLGLNQAAVGIFGDEAKIVSRNYLVRRVPNEVEGLVHRDRRAAADSAD